MEFMKMKLERDSIAPSPLGATNINPHKEWNSGRDSNSNHKEEEGSDYYQEDNYSYQDNDASEGGTIKGSEYSDLHPETDRSAKNQRPPPTPEDGYYAIPITSLSREEQDLLRRLREQRASPGGTGTKDQTRLSRDDLLNNHSGSTKTLGSGLKLKDERNRNPSTPQKQADYISSSPKSKRRRDSSGSERETSDDEGGSEKLSSRKQRDFVATVSDKTELLRMQKAEKILDFSSIKKWGTEVKDYERLYGNWNREGIHPETKDLINYRWTSKIYLDCLPLYVKEERKKVPPQCWRMVR